MGSHFEVVLSKLIGKRLCDECHKPLGNTPRRHHRRRMYHPDCYKEKKNV